MSSKLLQKNKLPRPKPIRRILVTAGPTREMLDPIRFITNLSTGEMGYTIARAAQRKGFKVTLISGPTALVPPKKVRFLPILTVKELADILNKEFFRHDVLIMTAAVGDFTPSRASLKKVPRRKRWKITFRQTPDLVGRLARKKGNRLVIGFSLETGNWLRRSHKKRLTKRLDGIVANYFSKRHNPFGRTPIHAALIDGRKTRILRLDSKAQLAGRILNWVIALNRGRSL